MSSQTVSVILHQRLGLDLNRIDKFEYLRCELCPVIFHLYCIVFESTILITSKAPSVSVLVGPYLVMGRSLNDLGSHWWILGRGPTGHIKRFLNILLAAVLRTDDKEARIEVGKPGLKLLYSSGRGKWWLGLEGGMMEGS